MRRSTQVTGFTYIELMVALVIVSLLAGLAYPLWALQVRREQERELRRALVEIRAAIDAYHQAYEEKRILSRTASAGYPQSLEELVLGVPDVSRPDGKIQYFLRRLPKDPTLGAQDRAAAWGIRGYRSPYWQPAAEGEVYDVYSLSSGIGLNGVAYREW